MINIKFNLKTYIILILFKMFKMFKIKLKFIILIVYLTQIYFIISHENTDNISNLIKNNDDHKDIVLEKNIVVVNDYNFEKVMKNNPFLLLLFYMPTCENCKSFMEEYEKIANYINKIFMDSRNNKDEKNTENSYFSNIVLGKVNVVEEVNLVSHFEIENFPTIKYFKGSEDKEINYTGENKYEDIINWLEDVMKPNLTKVDSLKQLDKLVDTHNAVILYFGKLEGNDYNGIIELSKEQDDMKILITDSLEIINKYKKKGFFNKKEKEYNVVILRNFDKKVVYSPLAYDISISNMNKVIYDHILPTFTEFNDNTVNLLFTAQKPGIYLFYDNENSDKLANENAINIVRNLADKLVKETIKSESINIYQFVTVDINGSETQKKLSDYIGVKGKKTPLIYMLKLNEETIDKYVYELNGNPQEISEEGLEEFIANYESKMLGQFYKSEDIPEKDMENNVRILVGKNFDDLIFKSNDGKDNIVFFYAPWCKHCQNFFKVYEELAANLAKNGENTIILNKIDATLNEVKNINIESFPTIILYPYNKKQEKGIVHTSHRDMQSIIDFINKHVENKIKFKPEYEKQNDLRAETNNSNYEDL